MKFQRLFTGSLLIITSCILSAAKGQELKSILVKADKPTAIIQPTMWGVFFEDINLGADGGIYAELIKNRSFEFNMPLMGWTVKRKKFVEGDLVVQNRGLQNPANPRYIAVSLHDAKKGDLELTNEGFRGMGIKRDLRYYFSVLYRQQTAAVKLHIELFDAGGNVLGDTILAPAESDNQWHKQEVSFTARATEPKAKLNIWFEGEGKIDLDMLSLFPSDTWKQRPGGMRADMIQLLADMKPGFIRFPGGCIVEGRDLNNRYQWKKTIGPVEDRQLIINRWNTEFAHRPTPDYYQTFGLGFFEYFQLAEDIGAQALPILNCGMACQFNTAEVVPLSQIDPYVQDALDLIEFANGDTTTVWGAVRAGMGHPAPFHLSMMGVGNENWGPQYVERLQVFTKAIKAKYPDMKLVNSSGTDPDGERFDYLNTELRKMNADLIDEHYYRRPEWFLQNAKRYDNYPRNASKIFAGEYAAQSDKTVSVDNRNNWQCALAEAAFMTGLERNADVVNMASYAPLFANADGWQWTPDLIWVNNLQSYGTPNYYVQKLFSLNKGSRVVPIILNNEAITGQDSLYATACTDNTTNELIIKVVNVSDKVQSREINMEGIKKTGNHKGTVIELKSDHLNAVNSFDQSFQVRPAEREIQIKGNKINIELAPFSFTVIRQKIILP